MSADGVKQPLDLLRMSVGKGIVVQMRHERELAGTLVGFDIHVNMILSRVTETTHLPAGGTTSRKLDMLYVRGDGVMLVSTEATA